MVFTPFQYALMIPFLRLGETILGVEHFETTVPGIIKIVFTDPIGSFAVLGIPLLHVILGWAIAWALVGPALFFPTRWFMRRVSNRVS